MQTTSGNEPKTPLPEEKPTERIEQSSSPLLAPPDASPFAANTIEVRLVLQPEDGHPKGRRIRHVIAIDGKTLQIGAIRFKQLHALAVLLGNRDGNQAMEQFAQWLTQLAEQQHKTALRTTGFSATPLTESLTSSTPAGALPAPSVETSSPPEREETLEASSQKELVSFPAPSDHMTTRSPSLQSVQPQSATQEGLQERERSLPPTKPEQLTLF